MDEIMEKINALESEQDKMILKMTYDQKKCYYKEKDESEMDLFCDMVETYSNILTPEGKQLMDAIVEMNVEV